MSDSSQFNYQQYDPQQLQSELTTWWREQRIFEPDWENAGQPGHKTPFYNLMMFPYPSAEGLHVGNMYAFTGADVYGRFRRQQGFDVFEPIGLDGFGIHSENFAIKIGEHPAKLAKITQQNFYSQLSKIGNGFSWEERLETYDPDYYRWTQWLFVQMFKRGLAYRGTAMVNWCPSCKTVLADEQVENGQCERCKSQVERKEMSSWYFQITKYADRLLENLDNYQFTDKDGQQHTGLQWPDKIVTAQRNWIGRQPGLEISYPLVKLADDEPDQEIACFTTRFETNFGATFIVLAPEHPLAVEISVPDKRAEVQAYIEAAKNKSEQERKTGEKEKTGVFTGRYTHHRLTDRQLPIYVADFVLTDYGSGAVVGVPAHDQRDFEFAKTYNLPIIPVIASGDADIDLEVAKSEQAYTGHGKIVNSSQFDGEDSAKMLLPDSRLRQWLIDQGFARAKTSYHLRDWLISRQRYWGPPIPLVYCETCAQAGRGERPDLPGWYSVPESQLPVELPFLDNYQPTGDGQSPLDNASEEWKTATCPACGGPARRETDVSDTFLDSSWYFLRYPSAGKGENKKPDSDQHPFPHIKSSDQSANGQNARDHVINNQIGNDNQTAANQTHSWFPVDAYIGGAEHAVLHLLYARFITMALYDWGYLPSEEPFPFLFGHGLIIKDGAKMSKSKGNVVNPDEYIEKYGADAVRSYLMFLGPYDQGGDFRDTGLHGMYKWLNRVWETVLTVEADHQTSPGLKRQLHQTIKNNSDEMAQFRFNTCLARLMEFVNSWRDQQGKVGPAEAMIFIQLLAPFAPFLTEALYRYLKEMNLPNEPDKSGADNHSTNETPSWPISIHLTKWPEADPKLLVAQEVTIAIQVNGKLRGTINLPAEQADDQAAAEAAARQTPEISTWLQDQDSNAKPVRKVVFVPGKILNFVL